MRTLLLALGLFLAVTGGTVAVSAATSASAHAGCTDNGC